MPWLRFIADLDWKPTPGTTTAYLAGMVQNVTRDCADKAIAAGKGVRLRKASKNSELTVVDEPTSLSEP